MERLSGPVSLRQIFLDRGNWWRFWAANAGKLRWAIIWNVARMLACQTGRLGWHTYACTRCGLSRRVPHTCKSRFCSRCGVWAANCWSQHTVEELLPVPYQHLIFSVPFELRPWLAANRRTGLNLLFRAVADTLLRYARSQGYRPGMLAVLHTFGSDLKWHPHLHVLITAGGLSLDGQRWLRRNFLPQQAIRPMYRYALLKALGAAARKGLLQAPPKAGHLRQARAFCSWLSQFFRREHYVYFSKTCDQPRRAVGYIGRYGRRPVMAEHRLLAYDGRTVTFRYKDYASGNLAATMKLPVPEFLGRLVRHIPDMHFRQLRFYGLFANRVRTKLLAQARKILGVPRRAPAQPPNWRERRKRSTGRDPLLCPRCRLPMVLVEVVCCAGEFRAGLETFDVRAYARGQPA
jgi:hypothetical protein